MVGFTTDDDGHWVALLDCGHRQHVRHDPPLAERPWVLTEDGRRAKLGGLLDCVRCDAFELPEHFVVYKTTDELTETTLPSGLRANHATKRGVWGRIVVRAGRVRYRVQPPLARTEELGPGRPGIVVPEVRHAVEPLGAVRFHVEFLHAPPDSA